MENAMMATTTAAVTGTEVTVALRTFMSNFEIAVFYGLMLPVHHGCGHRLVYFSFLLAPLSVSVEVYRVAVVSAFLVKISNNP